MTRRLLILMATSVPAANRSENVPTTPDQINPFTTTFNAFLMELQDGKVNLMAWRRVRRAAKKLFGDLTDA